MEEELENLTSAINDLNNTIGGHLSDINTNLASIAKSLSDIVRQLDLAKR